MSANAVRTGLEALGRQARWALPVGVFTGIALPDLAALLRPLLTAAVIGTLATTVLRLDWHRLVAQVRRPALPLLLAGWQLAASPLLVWAVAQAVGLPGALALLLILQAAAPPIGSSAMFALILGLDGGLCLVGAVLSTVLLPFSLTALVGLLLPGAGIQVDLGAFFARVSLLVAAPFAIAGALRGAFGPDRLRRNDDLLGGLNVVLLVVFAVAVMDGVTARIVREPGYIGLLLVLACVAGALLHGVAYWLFRPAGITPAFSAALLSGNRNMGLMLAVTAGTAGEGFALYAGLVQIPMYFAPLLLTPFVRHAQRRGR